ncbi:type I-E CRISPR-associated protein Cse1/CasA, partial [Micromonospora sp. NPDC000207]
GSEPGQPGAYALLDQVFRDWLARLGPGSDPVDERRDWQRLVRRAVARIGLAMVEAAGPQAWTGRWGKDHTGKDVHYSSSQAEAWFRTGLAKALPMAAEPSTQTQEATA